MTETVEWTTSAPDALRRTADATTAHLRTIAGEPEFTDGDTAAELLNVTVASVLDLIVTGDLDGIVIGGRPWCNAAALHLRATADTALGAIRTREARALARGALRDFLAASEVTGDWSTATEQRRPLVCKRRGREWLNYGIAYHSVVMRTAWLGQWVLRQDARPELTGMPVGPRLHSLLSDLPGVEPIYSATPLLGDGRAKSVKGWLRVDPTVWPVVVPEDVARAVGVPEGRDLL